MSRCSSAVLPPSPSISSMRYAETGESALASTLPPSPLPPCAADSTSSMAAVSSPFYGFRAGAAAAAQHNQWPASQLSRSVPSRELPSDFSQSPRPNGSVTAQSPRPQRRTTAPGVRASRERSSSPQPHPTVLTTATMSDAPGINSRSPSLIRRLSRGASNRLRRRASNQQSLRMRDQSAGPVLIRRRSDSTGASDLAQDVSDLELDSAGGCEDVVDELGGHPASRDRAQASSVGLGLTLGAGRTSNASAYVEGGVAASTSSILQAGTWVYKFTPKKQKQKRVCMWLDPNTARVCWKSGGNPKFFFIDDVREVRLGTDTRNMRDDINIPADREHLAISLVCDMPQRSKGATIKTMHFLMPDSFVFNQWNDVLSTVARERIEVMNALSGSAEKSERSMRLAWRLRKGTSLDGFFSLDDAKWLCRMLEINCSDHAVRTHFTRSDTYNVGKLDYRQYQDFINSFKERKDIQNLYRNIKFGTDLDMDLDAFLEFLRTEQGVDIVKERAACEIIFERFARPGQRMLSMQGFQSFLTSSSANQTLISCKTEAYFDRPLNEYFISSSHNTYLLGRQVRGESSVEGYITALIKGCRCVEIDCWDGDNGRPMVTHGRTLTSRVPFEDCVSVIAKYAFHSSPYPLIVSLEVHCNPEQQRTMVDLMIKYFDGTMLTEPISPDTSALPSPEELRKRILIKVKAAEDLDSGPPFMVLDASNGRSRARSVGSTMTTSSTGPSAPVLPPPCTDSHAGSIASMLSYLQPTSPSETTVGSISTPHGSIASGPTTPPSTSSSDSDDGIPPSDKPKRRKTSKIIPELGRLGVYTQGIGYTGFNAADAKTTNHVFSFNESTFAKLCSKNSETKMLLEKHNQRHLMRVYPAARRFDSSNFDPLQTWRRGVQMAALNWQTYDTCQQINTAMFAAGADHFGYVLKPAELRQTRNNDESADSNEHHGKKLVKFSVDIISAQRLPRPKSTSQDSVAMNPYIVFEMYSAEDRAPDVARGEGGADASAFARHGNPIAGSGIGSPLRKRTKIVEGNGFDPIYNESIGMTVVTKHPDLIFVRWTVHNSPEARSTASTNSGPLAVFTAKLNNLQPGYRHLPLFNDYGEQYRHAKLFVRIKKEAPVPLQQQDEGILHSPGTETPTHPSPRPEPMRAERSWRSRVFSRQPSQRRQRNDDDALSIITNATSTISAGPGPISRTQSIDLDGTTR